MATLNEITYNIKNLISGGKTNDDDSLSNRQLQFIINTRRAEVLLSYTSSGRLANSSIYQNHNFIVPLTSGAGNIPIPSLLSLNQQRSVNFIFSLEDDVEEPVQISSRSEVNFASENKVTKHSSFRRSYILDNVMFLNNFPTTLTEANITLSGLFSDPRDVSSYINDNTTQYPLPQELVNTLTMNIISNDMAVLMQSSPDIVNDALDDKHMKTLRSDERRARVRRRREEEFDQ